MRHTALLIIDMQRDFVVPGAPCAVGEAGVAVDGISRALAVFRGRGWPVVYVTRSYRADGSNVEYTRRGGFLSGERQCCLEGSEGARIVDELLPLPGETVITKPSFSAFFHTELDLILRNRSITGLAVTGVNTANCVRATVFDAVGLGYRTTVISDATAADTAQITQDNLRDMRAIGVDTPPLDEFVKG
ncbi:cysteine hydrolase family protein [Desulfohalovibrio reitneri]|uniref:cysteine hydrolase family protein n=1 Tax=Desulfohalovibrio reitneri TaxID=1307759 RepID=UPI0004A6FDA9|nr:isochorismatase family cysteine hydrolase [Desulfohalovibrio reitneri]